MTALVFMLLPDEVLLAMDTLSLSGEDKQPHKYCSKILALPHIGCAICGTGSLGLIMDWYVDVQMMILARDMDFLNHLAPERLREIAATRAEPMTSTIYHFGYSPEAGQFTGTAFRSKDDFVADPLSIGLGIKPGFDEVIMVAEDSLEQFGAVGAVLDIMARLRDVDDALPLDDRVGIGGQVHLLTMDGRRQFASIAGEWPDFDSQYEIMLRRLHEMNEESDESAAGDA